MQSRTLQTRFFRTIAGAAVLTALPLSLHIAKPGWSVDLGYALAKDGSDDDSGGSGGSHDNSGSGGGGKDSDGDSGGSGGSGGDGSDDDSNSGGSGGLDDDSGGPGNGGGRGRGGSGDDGSRDDGGAKVEISGNGIEVVNADGTKEEIENGRYERKDSNGRTVEERPASQADVNRLQSISRGSAPARRIEVGSIAKVERSAAGMEIIYTTGWKEELENGRYELKDPNNNTVVERPATAKDRARIQSVGGN